MTRARLFRVCVLSLLAVAPASAESLPETQPLTTDGDLAAQMVAGIDKYLMRELAASVEKRKGYWKPDYTSADAYTKSVQPNRERLRKILGVIDPRVTPVEMQYVASTSQPALVAEEENYKVYAVRWPVLEGVDGEGLLLEPKGKVVMNVVAIPDADWTPEMLVGLAPGVPQKFQFARHLADNSCRVIVPVLIDRNDTWSGNPKLGRMTNQPHREFIYRMAYEMGRHIIGYEIQKVMAAVDWLCLEKEHAPVHIMGYGEGGPIAFYCSALDERIQATYVLAYFGPHEGVWEEPIYRNVWRQLTEFGDAEVGGYLLPQRPPGAKVLVRRLLQVGDIKRPSMEGPPTPRPGRAGAAPGKLVYPGEAAIDKEWKRLNQLNPRMTRALARYRDEGKLSFITDLNTFLDIPFEKHLKILEPTAEPRKNFNSTARQKRQFDQLVAFTQKLLLNPETVREEYFWCCLDTSSLANYEKSTVQLRKQLWEDVIGKLPDPTQPMNPRTRLSYDEPKWKGYEVVLDLYPDVFAYGILLVPKDLKPGEKRPVVVCQHGLEGRPQDVVNPKKRTPYYNSFGAQLADRGYIVYAPQNPYIGQDRFRVLQRKANPLGLSLFSFIIRQHERTLDWLATLPFVDPERMAFYGLSYGGKTAMRVPAILPRYCLSICAGDFNEWVWKNVSIDYRNSYMFSGEYEMPEFDLGNTFNYAEMAALIAPRPFMVERGHDDGVGIDEWVAYEYAKVRRLYSRLKIPERTEIEFFAGGHEIHGQGTFRFLDRHLKFSGGS
jgi:dienelactone hydrolase